MFRQGSAVGNRCPCLFACVRVNRISLRMAGERTEHFIEHRATRGRLRSLLLRLLRGRLLLWRGCLSSRRRRSWLGSINNSTSGRCTRWRGLTLSLRGRLNLVIRYVHFEIRPLATGSLRRSVEVRDCLAHCCIIPAEYRGVLLKLLEHFRL